MKTIRTFTVLLLWLVFAASESNAVDLSTTIDLERFTLIDGNTFQYDTGHLLPTGEFRVIASSVESYSFWPLTQDFIAPFSGKPLLSEELFESFHTMNFIPRWVRSQSDYTIGFQTFVVVAVSGKGDPNPTITIQAQPQSVRVLLDSPAIFIIAAEPSEYLSYQWFFKGRSIAGATLPYLLITSVSKAQAGIYTVALTTGSKPLKSENGLLQVVLPVSIRTQPKSLTVKADRPAVFRVAVAGTPPFTYQWYYNETPIANATKSLYSIPKVQVDNAGKYGVVVSNGPSHAIADEATLTVQ